MVWQRLLLQPLEPPQYVYKYKSPEIGKKLYQEYIAGLIKTEQDFQKRLEAFDNGR